MIHVDEQSLLERAEEVQRKADVYKDLIFAHEIFKNKSKAYLAALKWKHYGEGSDNARETAAMATQEWNDFIHLEMQTLKKAGIAKVELEAAQVRCDAMRSALSARKAEVRSFGG